VSSTIIIILFRVLTFSHFHIERVWEVTESVAQEPESPEESDVESMEEDGTLS